MDFVLLVPWSVVDRQKFHCKQQTDSSLAATAVHSSLKKTSALKVKVSNLVSSVKQDVKDMNDVGIPFSSLLNMHFRRYQTMSVTSRDQHRNKWTPFERAVNQISLSVNVVNRLALHPFYCHMSVLVLSIAKEQGVIFYCLLLTWWVANFCWEDCSQETAGGDGGTILCSDWVSVCNCSNL